MPDTRSQLLAELEEEAVYVLRETAGQFERAAILFSGGKDSIVLTHLAQRAFAPGALPFPLLHVDTGHNFPETLAFRDQFAAEVNAELIVRRVQDTIDAGRAFEESGPRGSRNAIQSVTLMDAIRELNLGAAIGGGRRDEEKARAKERFFSLRSASGAWEPEAQRPELGRHFDGTPPADGHCRVFPLSNWTERDIWAYLQERAIAVPDLYFSHAREVFLRDGVLLARTPFTEPLDDERPEWRAVRFRTVGDATCTGAVESEAADVAAVIRELEQSRLSERAGRGDDRRSDAAMEDRKRQGYF